jgi:hypothetical protein
MERHRFKSRQGKNLVRTHLSKIARCGGDACIITTMEEIVGRRIVI